MAAQSEPIPLSTDRILQRLGRKEMEVEVLREQNAVNAARATIFGARLVKEGLDLDEVIAEAQAEAAKRQDAEANELKRLRDAETAKTARKPRSTAKRKSAAKKR